MVSIIVAAACLLCLLVLFFLLPGRATKEMRAPFWGLNIAHRGLHTRDKTIPENSLAAFDAAAKAGYGIELDIQLSKDGQVIVFHDDDLQRVCGLPGRVDSYTLSELQEARLEGSGEHIPLFTEVLQLVAGRSPLVVELKMGPRNAELCRKAVDILQAYEGAYCVESFDPRIVRWFKKHAPRILRGQLAAPASHLGAGPAGAIVGCGFAGFLGRPHFMAYRIGPRPFTVRIAQALCMRVAWTAHLEETAAETQGENDAVIFEFYQPETHFKGPEGTS